MKKRLLYLLLIFFAKSLFGQPMAATTSVAEISGNFVIKDKSEKQLLFTYKAKYNTDGSSIFELKTDGLNNFNKTFTLYDVTKATFTASFKNLFKEVDTIDPNVISENATDLFYQIHEKNKVTDNQPNTAYARLITSKLLVTLEYAREKKDKSDLGSDFPNVAELTIEQVDIEFEDGTIKNVILKVKAPDDPKNPRNILEDGIIQFRNNSPIGISGKYSPERLPYTDLYAYDPKRLQKLLNIPTSRVVDDEKNKQIKENKEVSLADVKFNLGDIIDYRIILENGKENYSPANQVITLTPLTYEVIVKKEERSKILEVRAYTDVVGINGDQPNGLVQIEGSKKIFLLEDKARLFNQYNYFGGLTYFEPVLKFSKIESTNKNLIPDTIGAASNFSNSKKKIINVNTIDLYKFQQSSLTFNLNMFKFSFPQAKLNFLIDAKVGVYRTGITDSLNIDKDKLVKGDRAFTSVVSTAMYGVNFKVDFLPDSRYSVSVGYSIFENKMVNENYHHLNGTQIGSYWFDGNFKSSDTTTLFARATFSEQVNNHNLNFLQAQIGVQFDIFKVNAK